MRALVTGASVRVAPDKRVWCKVSLVEGKVDSVPDLTGCLAAEYSCSEPVAKELQQAIAKSGPVVCQVDFRPQQFGQSRDVLVSDVAVLGRLGVEFDFGVKGIVKRDSSSPAAK